MVGARDLGAATLRSSLREFLDKASASGPDTVALVYFAGPDTCQHPTMRQASRKIAPAGVTIHIHDHDAAGRGRMNENLIDISLEPNAVDRSVENRRRDHVASFAERPSQPDLIAA